MRALILGALIAVFGALVTLIAEHYLTTVPERIWRYLALSCILIGLGISGLSSLLYPYLRDYHQHPVISTLLISCAAAVIAGSVWCLAVVGLPTPSRDVDTA